MRFLPSHPSEFTPYIENRTHMYQFEEGKWFGCDCLEKYGQKCPICEYNHQLYTCGKFTKEEARPLRLPNPRRRFISNVLIVKNNNAPETEGKVYRFEYGIQIMDMIRNAMNGYDDPDEGTHVDGFNPFDWKTGANFIYKATQGAMGPNLKESKFGKQRPISDKANKELSDKQIDEIEAQLYTLSEYEHKAEDARSYDEIVDYFKKKTGRSLFGIFNDGAEEIDESATSTSTTKSAVDTFAESESTESSVVVEDEDNFFDSLDKE